MFCVVAVSSLPGETSGVWPGKVSTGGCEFLREITLELIVSVLTLGLAGPYLASADLGRSYRKPGSNGESR